MGDIKFKKKTLNKTLKDFRMAGFFNLESLVHHDSEQLFLATFPAGWSPQNVVIARESLQNALNSGVGIT